MRMKHPRRTVTNDRNTFHKAVILNAIPLPCVFSTKEVCGAAKGGVRCGKDPP